MAGFQDSKRPSEANSSLARREEMLELRSTAVVDPSEDDESCETYSTDARFQTPSQGPKQGSIPLSCVSALLRTSIAAALSASAQRGGPPSLAVQIG